MGQALEFTDSNFQSEVLKSDVPVLVDFWAPWCGPCRMIGPVIEELAVENAGSFKVGKVNVDENQQLAMSYNVASIPAITKLARSTSPVGCRSFSRALASIWRTRSRVT